ncbi:RNA polymerase II degradation factor 1-like [Lycium ferocissimum]|uniref:RNA polymerase II degradation factor 1-like n=1 Tax=Lycium ferocissimum TaxID=112874 RepID=UPI002814BE91|nr:RNA polymerase II degradation factor 1-like [Lycium ferocissimum]
MDPPPIPSHITATPIVTNIAQQNYPDSASSSPRSRQNDTWDQESLPPVPGAKLRLMCSYGGHIIPRPHDKSLCYVGGDTRIVVADRHSSLSDLQTRLSHTLLNGRGFSLKYQLPNEDLDSLVSVTTDEDLENMIEEYDRTMSASPLKPSRLRLFLFLAKPETAASMGCLLADSKSETWFVDALNNASLLSRGLSDSAAVDNFLEIETIPKSDSGVNLDQAQNESLAANNRQMEKTPLIQEVQSTMPDSPMVETTSSFESSVSSPSMPNLPPIKVREDGQMTARFHDQMLGLDEQFSNAQKLDNGYIHVAAQAATPPLPTVIGGAAVMSSATLVNAAPATGENHGRVISDDEKSDHSALSARRKPPLPLQPIQRKVGDGYNLPSPDSKHAGGYNLQSPDSVASDSSIASGTSFSKHTVYQDAPPATGRETRVAPAVTDPKNNVMDYNSQIQMQQQVQDSVAMQVPQQNQQQQQQQFVPANAHYIQHTATGPVAYYQMYAPPTQQPLHQQMDQQYQMYYVPVPQTQPYNMTVQSNIADANAATASSQQQTPPNPTTLSPSAMFKEALPPIYPARTVQSTKPEMPANVYRTATQANPTVVQVPQSQFHQQYYGVPQVPPPSQQMAAVSNGAANFGYEYSHPMHEQVYYTQQTAPPLPSQYQTMTPTTAVLLSAQIAAENTTAQNRNP